MSHVASVSPPKMKLLWRSTIIKVWNCRCRMSTREWGITPQYLLQLPSLFGMQFLFPVGIVSASSQHKKGNPRPLEIPKGSGISWVSAVWHTQLENYCPKPLRFLLLFSFIWGVLLLFFLFRFVFVKSFSCQSLPARLGRSHVDPPTKTSANANWFKEEKNPPLPLTRFCTKAGRDPLSTIGP